MGSVLNKMLSSLSQIICVCLLCCVLQPTYMFVLLSCDYSESKGGSKSKGRKGAKNSATAAKVALMKLKLHAAGDKGLPQVKPYLFSFYIYSVPLLFCVYYFVQLTTSAPFFWLSRQKEPIFRCIFLKKPKTRASPCSSVPSGVWAKWWIMQPL